MLAPLRLATLLLALSLLGCKSEPTASASSENSPEPQAGAPSAGLQSVAVKDPSMNNMTAFTISIPAKWHFEGTLYQGGNCVQVPSSVFRATSLDGLSFAEALPPYGWIYGTGPRAAAASDCMPVKGPMTANEFLKILAASMALEPIGPDPHAAELNAKAQQTNHNPSQTVEVAGILTRSRNGSFTIKGTLIAQVTCTHATFPGSRSILQGMPSTPPSDVNQCVAYVSHISAPENQFDAVYRLWQTPGIGGHGGEKDWFNAYMKRSNDRFQAVMAQGQAIHDETMRQGQQAMAAQTARFNQFQADQATRQHMNDAFISTMQHGAQQAIANNTAAMNARSTAASNVVDFALDHRTVLDPTTGQLTKVSSSYNHTWIDSTGKVSYQTNSSTANPNGVLPGTWNEQQTVNGNGTPK